MLENVSMNPRRRDAAARASRRGCQFFAIVNCPTTFDPRQSDDVAPWRISAMTESAKKRITADVIILMLGLAILIVLAFVGAV
jgi:hypothetical protein